ncbi:MAG: hypothetical protein AAF436_12295 [Myxococcota bacterium]
MKRHGSLHIRLAMLCLAILPALAGCASEPNASDRATGSLSLDLTISGGVEIDEVMWAISGGDMPDMSGTIDTSAPGSTASVEVFGLPPGTDYAIDMQATSTDGELTCEGSGTFDISAAAVTEVHVMLNCEQPARFGAVRVNGKLNLCAELTKVVVSPLQASVGNGIDLQSAAVDEEGDSVEYLWTSGSGQIDDPSAANTTYTCTGAGDDQVTVTVSDDGFSDCVSEWTVPVTCAVTIYATGQLLTPGDPDIPFGEPGHDDTRENFVYAIDPATGIATPVSPATTGLPAALAGEGASRLLGFSSGQLVEVEPATGAQTPIGENNGLSATGLDVTADGRGFVLPFNDDFDTQQLHELDLGTGDATPIGSPTAVGDAIDSAAGNAPGTSAPFVIGLSSIGDTIYGVDLDTNSLIAIDSEQGSASVVGAVGAVGSVGGGAYSGFAAMTGVDEDADGEFDALFGNVNFFDDDGDPDTLSVRLGGVARYDLDDGTWSLVGTNPGVIFFGFASNPAP